MKISCIQTNPQNHKQRNLDDAQARVKEAAKSSRVVVLPEMFTYMGNESERVHTADFLGEGVFAELSQWAKSGACYVIGGSHSEKIKGNESKVYNTNCVFDPSGNQINHYQKIHLFNLKDAAGNALYCESDVFIPGNKVATFSIQEENQKRWHCAVMICYDLRFPEIFRTPEIQKHPLDILFLPAAFTHQTGQDHWEVLLRARAIENQCYVVACNQTGLFATNAATGVGRGAKRDGERRVHETYTSEPSEDATTANSSGRTSNETKRNYGNSMVIDPWGRVIARLGEEVGALQAELSLEVIAQARTRLPALQNRMLSK